MKKLCRIPVYNQQIVQDLGYKSYAEMELTIIREEWRAAYQIGCEIVLQQQQQQTFQRII